MYLVLVQMPQNAVGNAEVSSLYHFKARSFETDNLPLPKIVFEFLAERGAGHIILIFSVQYRNHILRYAGVD